MGVTIEDIILDRDKRGISSLRPNLAKSYVDDAANLILDNPGTAIIVTGFYILSASATETDGPVGAIVIGNALRSLGYDIAYVTDRYSIKVLQGLVDNDTNIIDFPITSDYQSKLFAEDILKELDPSVLISIERCGESADGRARNMRNIDITDFNAKSDWLFRSDIPSIGIGDGGNEIGMGNVAKFVANIPSLVEHPCCTTVTNLIITSVSNLGGYGLVAALSLLKNRNLLPSVETELNLLEKAVELGAVDGFTGKRAPMVDGFSSEENSEAIELLHGLLSTNGL